MLEQYEIIERIHESSHYYIEKARHKTTGQVVVLKSTSSYENEHHYSDLLRKEYDFLMLFNHKEIVKPIDLIEDDRVVLILEFHEGLRLLDLVHNKELSLKEKLTIAQNIVQVLGEIHNKGVLHMDVNPTNILWNPKTKRMTFLDFNISEEIDTLRTEFEGVRNLKGTMAYISPEQTGRINRMVDYRSDFYSLGVSLYELFVGRVPFESDDPMKLIHSHIALVPQNPQEAIDDLPHDLSEIIMKLMAKNVDQRYQTIDGILLDLDQVKKNIDREVEDENFVAGSYDYSDKLTLSQEVVGREKEINMLVKGFEHVNRGFFDHIYLKGYSGVGKTTVVKELYQSITESRGYFLNGKYDQYNMSVPYSAINQALSGFVKLLLAEDQKDLLTWKRKLDERLGSSAAVLVQLNPDFERILGKQAPIQILMGQEAINRFNHAIQSFLRIISDVKHPVVLFLDDLQWIDSASLGLLKGLYDHSDLSFFFLIGAYRSNEVDETHLLEMFFKEEVGKGREIKQMHIDVLKEPDVKKLIKKSLNPLNRIDYLTQHIMDKTKGNVFFVKQLLKHLHDESCIYFDYENKEWHVDECVEQEMVADNVADFLTTQMSKLDEEMLSVLGVASCVGNRFDIDLISEVLSLDKIRIDALLKQAVKENLIVIVGPHRFMFSHDQIQQAIYVQGAETDRNRNHLNIAKAKLGKNIWEVDDHSLLDIAGHLQHVVNEALVDFTPEQLINLFYNASMKASDNIAYDRAMNYLNSAINLIQDEPWEQNYEIQLKIHNQWIRLEYLTGQYETVEKVFKIIENAVQTKADLGEAYDIRIQTLMAKQMYLEGIEVSLQALAYYGVDMPLNPNPKDHERAFGNMAALLADKKIKSLLDQKVMSDQNQIAIMRILSSIVPITFNMNPDLMLQSILKMVELSVVHGNSVYSAFAYSLYGLVLCDALGDIELGSQFGELSMDVSNQFDAASELGRVQYMTSAHVLHFRKPLSEVIPLVENAYIQSVENGDLTYAGFAGHGYCYLNYFGGQELDQTLMRFKTYTNALEKYGQGTPALYQTMYMETIHNLTIKENEQWILAGEYFNEHEMLATFIEQNHKTALLVLYFHKMQLAYWFKEYDLAHEYSKKVSENLDGGAGLLLVPVYHQYASLIELARYKNLPEAEQDEAMDAVLKHQKYLDNLKQYPSYAHRYWLVEAEKASALENYDEARKLYEKAVQLSKKHKFLNEEALCRELTSYLYNALDNKELETYYRKSAYSCYKRWGASNKASWLIKGAYRKAESFATKTIFSVHTITTNVGISSELDLHSILKFSQTIAKEIVFENLLKKMLDILIENAGAQRAVVMNFAQEGGLTIADYGTSNHFELVHKEHLEEVDMLPMKIINTAYNGQNIVILNKVSTDPLFESDPYIKKNHVKSLMCFPIVSKGNVVGIIYLENNLSEDVFSVDRLEFLTLLSSQIAISFENAMIYSRLEDLVKVRTNELESKNDQLLELNSQLMHISMTDSLTGLFNRRRLEEALNYEAEKNDRYHTGFSIILMDVDYFKTVNDTYGHHVGDQVLIGISEVLKANTRSTDMVGRWGGEEFIILCPEIGCAEAQILAEKIRTAIEKETTGRLKQRTGSFGVAEYKDKEAIKDLLKRADQGMYKAKELGRNQVCINLGDQRSENG